MVGTVGVDVDDERWRPARSRSLGDGGDDGRDATGVVPVPVRQEEDVDAREVDCEPLGVGEPNVAVGSDVEQHGSRVVSSSRGRPGPRSRDTRTRGGRTRQHSRARRAGRSAGSGRAGTPAREAAAGRARSRSERVGRVVDDDRDGELVEVGCFPDRCHGLMFPAQTATGSASRSGSMSSAVSRK